MIKKMVPEEYLDPGLQHLAFLITNFLDNSLSEPDSEELENWVGTSDSNMELFSKLTDKKNIEAALEQYRNFVPEGTIEKIKDRIF